MKPTMEQLKTFAKNYFEECPDSGVDIDWTTSLDRDSLSAAIIGSGESLGGEVCGIYDCDRETIYLRPEINKKEVTAYLLVNKISEEPVKFECGEQFFFVLLHEIGHVLFKEPFSENEQLVLMEILVNKDNMSIGEYLKQLGPISAARSNREHKRIDSWALKEFLNNRSKIRKIITQ